MTARREPAEAAASRPPLLWHSEFQSVQAWVDHAWWQWRAFTADPGLALWGRRVLVPEGTAADGRDATFWHAITSDTGGAQRHLSPLRVAMVGQAWDLLERLAAGDRRVIWWREWSRRRGRRGGKRRRLFVASEDFRFVVVLAECRYTFRLVTFYPVDGGYAVNLCKRFCSSWARGASRRDCYRPPLETIPVHRLPAAGRRRARGLADF